MTNPANAYIPPPWMPDVDRLRDQAASAALTVAACVAAGGADAVAQRLARAALATDHATGTALTDWCAHLRDVA